MKYLGTTDQITCCDCCGKSPLKMTVMFATDGDEVVYYGSTCAARNTGRKVSDWQNEAKKEEIARGKLARVRFQNCAEHIRYMEKLGEARAMGLIGRPAAEHVRAFSGAAHEAKQRIANEFNCGISLLT